MTQDLETGGGTLRQFLIEHYEDLGRRLTRRLGSADLAQETLHELYLRPERPGGVGVLENPLAYIITMAVNLVRGRWRTENRRAKYIDREAFYDLIDENPDPDQADDVDGMPDPIDETPDPLRRLEARLELEALVRAFDELTPRRRRILFASRVEGVRLRDLAAEFRVSQRMVEKDLKAALTLCAVRLGRGSSHKK